MEVRAGAVRWQPERAIWGQRRADRARSCGHPRAARRSQRAACAGIGGERRPAAAPGCQRCWAPQQQQRRAMEESSAARGVHVPLELGAAACSARPPTAGGPATFITDWSLRDCASPTGCNWRSVRMIGRSAASSSAERDAFGVAWVRSRERHAPSSQLISWSGGPGHAQVKALQRTWHQAWGGRRNESIMGIVGASALTQSVHQSPTPTGSCGGRREQTRCTALPHCRRSAAATALPPAPPGLHTRKSVPSRPTKRHKYKAVEEGEDVAEPRPRRRRSRCRDGGRTPAYRHTTRHAKPTSPSSAQLRRSAPAGSTTRCLTMLVVPLALHFGPPQVFFLSVTPRMRDILDNT